MKRSNNILSKLKSQVKLIESLITEGDHWPEDYRRKAINRIKLATAGKTPVYSENGIEHDVDSMISKFEPLSHKNSNLGYFLPIIRLFIGYTGNDQAKRKEFVDTKMDMLVKNLGLISSDPSLESKFKDDIKQKWSLEDFEKHAAELQAEIDKADADSLASVTNSDSSDYDIILIDSYKELHDKFGGNKTGYKGQSKWCHSNGKSTYDSWTSYGSKQFFVLAKKGWENIQPPVPETTNAYDEYGTSLIAILVKVETSELLYATLRWNHIIDPSKTVPKTSVDKAFLGWGDLSKAVGFNVKAIVKKDLKRSQDKMSAKIKKVMTAVNDKLKTVSNIDYYTLTNDEKRFITYLDIPNNITSIGIKAFENCSSLAGVTIPDSVTSIEAGAFFACRELTSITIGNGVTKIGANAFAYCESLTSITIPDSVTRIGQFAFVGCKGLINMTIPDSVTHIGSDAFQGCEGLTSVTIGNGVTSIGDYVFSDCGGLTNITIPNSVTSIGYQAFTRCRSLTSITIPDSVMSIGEGAFFVCIGLTSITIPDSVTNIGPFAFNNCRGLTSVTIGKGVSDIGDAAFINCQNLKKVLFKGKTMDEVRSMTDSPWGIKNPEKVIRVADASN